MIYLDLVLNLALLIALSVVSGFLHDRFNSKAKHAAILQGCVFGLAAVVGMLKPMNLGNGLIFDGRSVMISLAALYFGPLGALPSVIPPLALRIGMGGDGVVMGVAVILMSALSGLIYGRTSRKEQRVPSSVSLYLFGLIVHALMILCMLLLPGERILPTLRSLGPAIIVLYPLATVLAGKILSDALNNNRRYEELKTKERQYRESLDFIPVPVGVADSSGKIRFLNQRFRETFGYKVEDIPDLESWKEKAYPDPVYREEAERQWNADLAEARVSASIIPTRMYRVVRSDGTERHVDIGMRIFGDLFLSVFQDLTEREYLDTTLRNQLHELSSVRDAAINSMAILSEFRDTDTGLHIQRTKHYVKVMIERLGPRAGYSPEACDRIWRSAPLHDIGKIAIPDSILLKPGRLTPEEEVTMRSHVLYGSDAIKRTREFAPEDSFLDFACEIVEFHHERWDGTGYPHGLSGPSIPLSARVMAVADVYDACISERPYKAPIPHAEVIKIIEGGRGTHFDPDLVDLFSEIHGTFEEIASCYHG